MSDNWTENAHVTISLEYFDHLREREKELKKLKSDLRNCITLVFPDEFSTELKKAEIDIDRLVELALKTSLTFRVREEKICYTNINRERILSEQEKEAK